MRAEAELMLKIATKIYTAVDNKLGLITAPKMQVLMNHQFNVELKVSRVRNIIKHRLYIMWKKATSYDLYVNSHKNLVLRQKFAATLIKIIAAGKQIIKNRRD